MKFDASSLYTNTNFGLSQIEKLWCKKILVKKLDGINQSVRQKERFKASLTKWACGQISVSIINLEQPSCNVVSTFKQQLGI